MQQACPAPATISTAVARILERRSSSMQACSVAADVARADARTRLERSVAVGADLSGARALAWWGVCLLILIAPFEALRPLLRLPGQSLSTVETVMLVVFAVWAASLAAPRYAIGWRTPLVLPFLVFLAAALVAALAAPGHRANALHMVGRFGLLMGVFVVTTTSIATAARLRTAIAVSAAAGAIVSGLVITEYLRVPVVLSSLAIFRDGIAVVGAQVRAGGPFQYPTIASMYLEIVFAMALALLPVAVHERRHRTPIALAVALALIAEAITLTFTRAGLITTALSLVIVLGVRLARSGFDGGARVVALVALFSAIQFLASPWIEFVRMRLTSQGKESWYRARFAAPAHLAIDTGATVVVPVSVTNTGRVTGDPAAARPFRFAYHWLHPEQELVVEWEGIRTDFAGPVLPGERVTVQARVRAPLQPGAYRLMWDVEQEQQLWFSTEPDAEPAIARATVTGPLRGSPEPPALRPIPKRAVRPGRLVLWGAAARMVAAHPLTGVGPDNFRLEYGPYAGISQPDPRMHSNNMYIEVLAGTGIIGGLAFMWLCRRASRSFLSIARDAARGRGDMLGAGIAAAGVAIGIHGLVDSFLSFTATYILIAITLGLCVTCELLNRADDANRV